MITVKNMAYRYANSHKQAVADLSFEVQPGEIFGFLGPSGAGKSTTQKILISLLKDYSGEISVFGKDLKQWDNSYYEQVGVSFELPNHFLKLTANENLRYYRSLYAGKTHNPQEILTWVGLEDDGDTLVSQYSKGMKNRLSVARALLHNPQLIFFDEPTAGLDPVNARNIKDIILEQKSAGKTVFLTTHDMQVADQLCDRVAFIVDGNIRLIDSPHKLKIAYQQPLLQVEYRKNDANQTKEFPMKGLHTNQEFQEILKQNHLIAMHTMDASLEDIFIKITGRSLS
ncbi:MAG: ABC transporter ATP-binding protein [Anaerolineaceae bacterium]|nr:ABC transporter ATP-binding protein [Anaerolineaceae bacterium]